MFKLMHKKLNKKGFTLAELLVVVAVIAILVAIAIPVFTQAMKKAQIRTNDANIRSTKAAAITQIMDEWDTYKPGAKKGTVGKGWWAIGHVTPDGKLDTVNVYITSNTSTISQKGPAVGYTGGSSPVTAPSNHQREFPSGLAATTTDPTSAWILQDNVDAYSTTSPTGTAKGYYTLVFIDDVEDQSAGKL